GGGRVIEKRLGIGADEIEVEAVKQIVGAVTAARGEDGANFGIGKGGVEIGEAIGGGCGEVRRVLAEGVRAGNGVVAAGAQGGDSLLNALGIGAAGGSDDGDAG